MFPSTPSPRNGGRLPYYFDNQPWRTRVWESGAACTRPYRSRAPNIKQSIEHTACEGIVLHAISICDTHRQVDYINQCYLRHCCWSYLPPDDGKDLAIKFLTDTLTCDRLYLDLWPPNSSRSFRVIRMLLLFVTPLATFLYTSCIWA